MSYPQTTYSSDSAQRILDTYLYATLIALAEGWVTPVLLDDMRARCNSELQDAGAGLVVTDVVRCRCGGCRQPLWFLVSKRPWIKA